MMKPTFGLFTRLLLGGILCYSGFSKAVGPSAEFAASIMNYHLVPSWIATLAAYGLPWIELYTGTMLVFGFQSLWAVRAARGLFGLFVIVLLSALLRGLDIGSCGCFGAGLSLAPRTTVGIDSLLLAMTFVIPRAGAIPLSLDNWIRRATA